MLETFSSLQENKCLAGQILTNNIQTYGKKTKFPWLEKAMV